MKVSEVLGFFVLEVEAAAGEDEAKAEVKRCSGRWFGFVDMCSSASISELTASSSLALSSCVVVGVGVGIVSLPILASLLLRLPHRPLHPRLHVFLLDTPIPLRAFALRSCSRFRSFRMKKQMEERAWRSAEASRCLARACAQLSVSSFVSIHDDDNVTTFPGQAQAPTQSGLNRRIIINRIDWISQADGRYLEAGNPGREPEFT
ncbi:hypothetical protein B0H14DRAFT_3875090 [Mycena olivaceomarginata]|nr:hypothetical protein B0H14DRAFT_3875090 [Mycena olivaceomarginata]